MTERGVVTGVYGWLLAVVLAGLVTAPAVAGEPGPEEIVRDSTEQVIAGLREREGELDEAFVKGLVHDHVLPHVNFELITRFALGRHWNDATEAQRSELTEEIRKLLVRTYSQPLLEYSGEDVTYGAARVDQERGRASMRVDVKQRGGPAIPLTYQFRHREGDGWQIYDVVVEGVSLVTNYRDSFGSEIRRNGVEGLLERIRERNRRGETEL